MINYGNYVIRYFANFHRILLFRRHRHSFVGNNLEKLPRSETNLARYQTNLALDQVEQKGIAMRDSSSFNIISAESCGITVGSVLSRKNREGENEKLSKRNIRLETIAVRIFHIDFLTLIFRNDIYILYNIYFNYKVI